MRYRIALALFAFVAHAAGAGAQPGDAQTAAPAAASPKEARITLDLRSVPVGEAVRKLAEVSRVTLTCSPKLTGRKVSLMARGQPATDVAEALACAVSARWRQVETGSVLEPVEPVRSLAPRLIVEGLRRALTPPGPRGGLDPYRGSLDPEFLTPEQAQELEARGTLPAARLSPEQQANLIGRLHARATEALEDVALRAEKLRELDAATVRLSRGGPADTLVIEGTSWRAEIGISGTINYSAFGNL